MEFGILGPLTVRSDAGRLVLGGARQRALLALLLLHRGQPVTAGRLGVSALG
jgi:DNA-binding SARP family transcriptional activator